MGTRGPRREPPISELERLRRAGGWSVAEFAEAIGVGGAYVSHVEAGREKPSARFRAAACNLVSSRLGSILFDERSK